METQDFRADERAEQLADQRRLVVRLAARVFVALPEHERGAFLQELQENLQLGAVMADRPEGGNSNPGAFQVPDIERLDS